MHVTEALRRMGGVADSRTLRRVASERRIRTAVSRGEIVQVGRRGYALPMADTGAKAAMRLRGAASHLSAAALHGWEIAKPPERPSVIVPRSRRVDGARRRGVDLRWRELSHEELDSGLTARVRTVIDCARDLPFAEALAVADSALRHGEVTQDELLTAAARIATTGRARALRVACEADGRAANPFESVLRALALDAGLSLEPQVVIVDRGFRGRPDLVDVERRWVIEAESHEFHASKAAFAKDCRRYTALVIRGWTVLRFTWHEVMDEPDYVRACLVALAEGRLEHAALDDPLFSVA